TFRTPIRISVQERFRKPEDMRYGDVTITEWNLATQRPSELHKLDAQLFVYGFYDDHRDQIVFATAIDVLRMQWMLCRGEIEYSRRSRIDQHFIGLPFKRLKDLGASLFTHDGRICQLCGGTAADAAIEYRGRIDGWVHYGCAEERAA